MSNTLSNNSGNAITPVYFATAEELSAMQVTPEDRPSVVRGIYDDMKRRHENLYRIRPKFHKVFDLRDSQRVFFNTGFAFAFKILDTQARFAYTDGLPRTTAKVSEHYVAQLESSETDATEFFEDHDYTVAKNDCFFYEPLERFAEAVTDDNAYGDQEALLLGGLVFRSLMAHQLEAADFEHKFRT